MQCKWKHLPKHVNPMYTHVALPCQFVLKLWIFIKPKDQILIQQAITQNHKTGTKIIQG